jgi:hypothetical protein
MKMCVLLAASLGLPLLSPSLVGAATKADLEGKKICWGGNNWTTFSPGGKATSSVAGAGTWTIAKTGDVSVKFPGGPFSGVMRIKDGGVVEYTGSWVGAPNITAAGSFCN